MSIAPPTLRENKNLINYKYFFTSGLIIEKYRISEIYIKIYKNVNIN